MESQLDTYEKRNGIRKYLEQADHSRRIFDISGVNKDRLDYYRKLLLESLTALDDADHRFREEQDTVRIEQQYYERLESYLRDEIRRLSNGIEMFHKNMPYNQELSFDGSIDELPLKKRVKKILTNVGFIAAQDLLAFNLHDFRKIPGVGDNAIDDINWLLFQNALPRLSDYYPPKPYSDSRERVLRDIDEPVESLMLHPHVEFLLKSREKHTVRSVLLMPANEELKLFPIRGQGFRYYLNILRLMSFPGRPIPAGIVSEYGTSDLFFSSPARVGMSTHSLNILTSRGILTLGDLLVHSRVTLQKLTGFSLTTLYNIQNRLKKHDLQLRRKGKEIFSV